jgi:hypothetical protein
MREELNVWDGEWMRGGESYRQFPRERISEAAIAFAQQIVAQRQFKNKRSRVPGLREFRSLANFSNLAFSHFSNLALS